MAPGSSVKLGVTHQGQTKTLTLALGTLPEQKEASTAPDQNQQVPDQRAVPDGALPELGLTLVPSSKVSGSGNEGVVVTTINAGGVAAEHGLQIGDIILEVGGKTVSTPAEVRKSLADARSEGKHTVLFRVKSGDGMKFVALPLGNA
jgi:serine protease Do